MRYPDFIKNGNTVGFVSPSFSPAIEPYRSAFDHSLDFWKKEGFRVLPGPNIRRNDGVGICAPPDVCAKELQDFYLDPGVDALISCGGGELMCETVSRLDFKKIGEGKPKWYMGYSDNTNFTFLLTTICDVASLYAPCAPEFGAETLHPSILDAYRVLTGKQTVVHNYDLWEKEERKDEEHPLEPYNCTEPVILHGFVPDKGSPKGYREEQSVSMKGRLLGGCLDCLENLVGTRFDHVSEFAERYREEGILWYLEACDLTVYGIRRALWHMEEAGWFRHAKGFLIGRPNNGEEMFGLDRFDAVLPYCVRNGVSAILDADVGHKKPMMPLINGSLAEVILRDGDLTIDMGLDLVYDECSG